MKNFLKQVRFFLPLIAFIVSSGCVPCRFTQKPGVSGYVFDTDNGQPIQEANVTLMTFPFPERLEKTDKTITKEDGSFSIPAEYKWSIYIVPMDPLPLEGTIIIEKEGYKTYTKHFYLNTMGLAIEKFNHIWMEPLQSHSLGSTQ